MATNTRPTINPAKTYQTRLGTILTPADLQLMADFHEHRTVFWSDAAIRMHGGRDTHIYVRGREELTDSPLALRRLGVQASTLIRKRIADDKRQVCLIGLPTAGTGIAAGIAAADLVRVETGALPPGSIPFCFRIMRETKKEGHGVHNGWVNGDPDPQKHLYIDVDNVMTDAGTKLKMRTRFSEASYPVDEMYSLIPIDREQGGMENLAKHGVNPNKVIVMYKLIDVVDVFVYLGMWPEERYQAVSEEIAASKALVAA